MHLARRQIVAGRGNGRQTCGRANDGLTAGASRRRVAPSRSGADTAAATPGFTVIEVVVVMAIILVLAGLILATSSYVHNKGARSRAEAEIAAISAALENYKADNGIYPSSPTLDARASGSGDPTQASYKSASLILYRALSGDADNDANRSAELTSYMSFKPNQLSPNDQTMAVTFIKDPFGNSYGYSTAGQAGGATGYNPTFDLWSTAGTVTTPADPAPWIKNW